MELCTKVSTRRTTSLSMSTAKASAICCAIRGQPHLGLRRFMSTMASTSALDGPWGPVRRVLAPLAVDQAAVRCSCGHESAGHSAAPVSTIATNTRRVTRQAVKM